MHSSEHQCAWIWKHLTVSWIYPIYWIFVIFIQSLFFNHSEHKVLNISLICLFCTQGAEHPKLPINAANAAVFHHLPPFLMKEPFKKIIFENQIRMLLLWRDYFHRINLQILWLTPQHPQPILCPGFPRCTQTCSRHHQPEPTTSKERLGRVWLWVLVHLVNSEEFLNSLSDPRHSRLQACHVFDI